MSARRDHQMRGCPVLKISPSVVIHAGIAPVVVTRSREHHHGWGKACGEGGFVSAVKRRLALKQVMMQFLDACFTVSIFQRQVGSMALQIKGSFELGKKIDAKHAVNATATRAADGREI